MMKSCAALAALAMLLSTPALAADEKEKMDAGAKQGTHSQAANQQLTGKVLQAARDKITIEYNGAAIPFVVNRQTQFQGVTSARDLQEGQHVRANFELKKDKNELHSISIVSANTGSEMQKSNPAYPTSPSDSPGSNWPTKNQ